MGTCWVLGGLSQVWFLGTGSAMAEHLSWPVYHVPPAGSCISDASCIMMAYASVMACVSITSRLSATVRGYARLTRPGAYPPGHQPPRFTPCFTPRFTPRASCRVACAAVPRGRRRALGPLRAASRCGSRAGCAAAGRRPARDTARRVQPHVPMAVSDDPTIRVRLPISDDSVAHVSVTASVRESLRVTLESVTACASRCACQP